MGFVLGNGFVEEDDIVEVPVPPKPIPPLIELDDEESSVMPFSIRQPSSTSSSSSSSSSSSTTSSSSDEMGKFALNRQIVRVHNHLF